MAIRIDNSINIELNNIDQISNKTDLRNFLLNQWIIESIETKYRYFVETLSNGNRIYLERPGQLNKGCDFVILIENHIKFKNGNDKPPKHDLITDDLFLKKQNIPENEYNNIMLGITKIYNCQPYTSALSYVNNQPEIGLSYELIFKMLRWLFIEQDITYWARSGRKMLLQKIVNL